MLFVVASSCTALITTCCCDSFVFLCMVCFSESDFERACTSSPFQSLYHLSSFSCHNTLVLAHPSSFLCFASFHRSTQRNCFFSCDFMKRKAKQSIKRTLQISSKKYIRKEKITRNPFSVLCSCSPVDVRHIECLSLLLSLLRTFLSAIWPVFRGRCAALSFSSALSGKIKNNFPI